MLSIREFADRVPIALSSDGRYVAFTLLDKLRADSLAASRTSRYFAATGAPTDVLGADVFVTDTRAGETTNLTRGRGSSWGPAWSPDGRVLAFFSDRDGVARVWVWERDRQSLRRVSSDPVRVFWGFQGIRWSPNGRSVLVKLSPFGMTTEQLDRLLPVTARTRTENAPRDTVGAVTATVYSSSRVGDSAAARSGGVPNLDSTRSFLNAELSDLAIIDVRTGLTRRVAPRVRAMGYAWAPGGAHVAFTTRQPDGGRGHLVYDTYDLFVADTIGPPRLVVSRVTQAYGQRFSWSPLGDRIAFESGKVLHVVSARPGANPMSIPAGGRRFTHEYRPPLWIDEETLLESVGDTLFRIALATGSVASAGSPVGRQLLEIVAPPDAQRLRDGPVMLAVRDPLTKRAGFYGVDLRRGTVRLLHEDDVALGATSLLYHVAVSSDGRTVAYVAERGDRPPDIWIADPGFTAPRRVTDLHAQITRFAFGRSRLVRWAGPAGEVLSGALLLPSAYVSGARYPLIVKVYGGSRLSNRLNRFGLESGVDNLQLLATRGYAVLLPDTPLRDGRPLADLAATVMPAVDSVIAMGIADRERIGVIGHSYGGYSALALLVQTNRFKAGVSSGGFSNLFAQYGEMRSDGSAVGINWSERDQGRMGGSPWEFRIRYFENSPFFFLDRVTAPVLLLHGAADRTVLPARAEETFVALRRLGKAVVLVRYEGEEHHPGSWSFANAADYWNRIFGWFDEHLQGR